MKTKLFFTAIGLFLIAIFNILLLFSDNSILTVSVPLKDIQEANVPFHFEAKFNNLGIIEFIPTGDLTKYDARANISVRIKAGENIIHQRSLQLFDLINLKLYPAGIEVDKESFNKVYLADFKIQGYLENVDQFPLMVVLKYKTNLPTNIHEFYDLVTTKILYSYKHTYTYVSILFYITLIITGAYFLVIYNYLKPIQRLQYTALNILILTLVPFYAVFLYNSYIFIMLYVVFIVVSEKILKKANYELVHLLLISMSIAFFMTSNIMLSNYFVTLFFLSLCQRLYCYEK